MKRSCKELKRIARENLTGHYQIPMGALVITNLILMVVQFPFSIRTEEPLFSSRNLICLTAQILIALVDILFTCGMLKIHLGIARGEEYSLPQLFYFFQNHPDRILLAGILMAFVMLAASVPMIAGCLAAYYFASVQNILIAVLFSLISLFLMVFLALRFGLLYFVLTEHEEAGVLDAFQISSHMIRGRMGRLLYMELSFIGMYLLAILSFGIGSFWVEPYQMQTLACFYLEAAGELPEPKPPVQNAFQTPPTYDHYV